MIDLMLVTIDDIFLAVQVRACIWQPLVGCVCNEEVVVALKVAVRKECCTKAVTFFTTRCRGEMYTCPIGANLFGELGGSLCLRTWT